MAEPRRTFGPVVLLGLASAGLAAVAAARPWMAPSSSVPAGSLVASGEGSQVPLAHALALAVLAAWGALLVTRGRMRRAVAALAVLAASGTLAATIFGWWAVPDALRRDAAAVGAMVAGTDVRGWYWLAVLGAVGAIGTTSAALLRCRQWPEMGRRYDAPASRRADRPATGADQSNLDLWRSLDEGRDPTEAPD